MKLLARHDTLIAILGTGILTAGYYWGIARPGAAAAQKIEDEISQLHGQMKELPGILEERSNLQNQLEQQQQLQERVNETLPADSHVSEVLHQVASLARSSGLTINRLEPLPTVEASAYATHPFHLSCRGDFQDIARFLNGLENQPRLITFGNVDLIRSQDETQRSVQATINFNVYSRQAKTTKLAENASSRSSLTSDN